MIINVDLSPSGIDEAIKKVESYHKDLKSKCKEVEKRIAERVRDECITGFSNAVYDDIIGEEYKHPDINVEMYNNGNCIVIEATGYEVLFVEFGAGVYHNSGVGSSKHPKGQELGLTIGSYGPNGAKKVWGFYDENDELKLTRGTPANMPMWNAVQTVSREIPDIVKEVFND